LRGGSWEHPIAEDSRRLLKAIEPITVDNQRC
jgi:hypothetical protein